MSAALLQREATLRREIEEIELKLSGAAAARSAKRGAAATKRRQQQQQQPQLQEADDDDDNEDQTELALDAMTERLEAMVEALGVAGRALDRRDEALATQQPQPRQPKRVRFPEGIHAPTRTGKFNIVPRVADADRCLDCSSASALVDVMAMLDEAPTEALVEILGRLRASNNSAGATRQAAGGSLNLQGGEATALVEIMSMMESAPLEVLADILSKLRTNSLTTIPKAPGLQFSSSAATAQPVEEEDDDDDDDEAEEEAAAMPPVASAAARLEHAAAMQRGRARLLRHILLCYFQRHAPEGVHKVEALVARVVGGPPTEVEGVGVVGGALWSEAELFTKLEAKYGKRVDLDPHSIE